MTLIREFSTMYASMFSFVLFMILFESRYPKRKTLTLTLSLMVPLMLLNFVLLYILGPVTMSTLLLLTCSLPSLIFFWILAKNRDGRFFFTFCFADTLMLEIIDITAILDFYLGNTYLFMAAARLILCPLLVFAMYRWVRPVYLDLQEKINKGWYIFAVIALLFYVVLSLSISVPTHILERPEQLPAFLLLLVLMPAIYLHIFSTLRYQQKAHEMTEKDQILRIQVANLAARMNDYIQADNKFRTERHDFRHRMTAIAGLIEKGEYEELRCLVQEYSDTLSDIQVQRYCDHAVIDAVLASYLPHAQQQGIRISTRLAFPDKLPVNEAELATVFANALENAVNACEKVPLQKRYLE
ncbi:MAG: hypothetical protein IKU09_00365, partial [Firmicutes bacterium]|nr:hypothetical protein [Bacillota bacterium]